MAFPISTDLSRLNTVVMSINAECSVVNNFLFAHQTDVLADEQEAARLRHNSHELLKGINMNKHFPWIPDILEALPQLLTRPTMPPGLIDMLELFDVSFSPSMTVN